MKLEVRLTLLVVNLKSSGFTMVLHRCSELFEKYQAHVVKKKFDFDLSLNCIDSHFEIQP